MATKAHEILEYHCYRVAPFTPKNADTALEHTRMLHTLMPCQSAHESEFGTIGL